jgi:phosphate/sulfate permease
MLLATLAQATAADLPRYAYLVFFGFAVLMLIWDTVEVGRNDAANLVNAVYGARLMTRKRAVRIAGMATIIGAMLSSGVIETARKGIFAPSALTVEEAITVYVSVYVVDTVLLYGFSAFGMPVSTTACLVFELLGASFMMQLMRSYESVVYWNKAGAVVSAIVMSIFLSLTAAFLIQRIVRGCIREKTDDPRTMMLHGSWIGGGLATGLFFFLILKGAKAVPLVKAIRSQINALGNWLKGGTWHDPGKFKDAADEALPVGAKLIEGDFNLGMLVAVMVLWIVLGFTILLLIKTYREKAAGRVFPVLAVVGMVAMAVAFGQNDLANCASPGLSTITLLMHPEQTTAEISEIKIGWYFLLGCGVLLFLGMRTKNATRVTKAGVNMGSQADRVRLYAPQWCIALATPLARSPRPGHASLAPRKIRTAKGKRLHYDAMRASVIMGVSASVIALASSYKLPVSTTYVTFAAVVGSGMGDRIFQHGDAALKLARAIWVVFSWFAAALVAAIFTAVVCAIIHFLGIAGLAVTLGANLYLRKVLKRRGDAQARRTREELQERSYPERFASEYE